MAWVMELEDEGLKRTFWSRPSIFHFQNLSDNDQLQLLKILRKIDAEGLKKSERILKKLKKNTFIFKSGPSKRVVLEWLSDSKEFKVIDILDRKTIKSLERLLSND